MDAIPPTMQLAEAAVARLCHDLSGPLGTVMNAVELAGGGTELADEALQLALEAARELSDRLRLARTLWGSGGDMRTTQVLKLAAGLPARAGLRLHADDMEDALLSAEGARLLTGVLLLASDSLRGRGEIVVAGGPQAGIVVMIAGPRAAWPPELPTLLQRSADAWAGLDARALASRLAVLLAEAAGAKLSLLMSTGAPSGVPPLLISLAG